MKATTIIIGAALTLTVNVLFAGNDINSTPVANASATITRSSLVPTVPVEATFDDAVTTIDFASLAPVMPTEAQFEDLSYEMVSALNLAPVTPLTADVDEGIDYGYLAPAIPVKADFE
jgi:hypothetical protein